MNNVVRRLISFSVDKVPGLALLIWTLVLVLVGLDSMASTSYGLFWYYPFYSLIIWMVIGAFAKDKVWETLKFGCIGHIILLGFVIYIISTAKGGYYFAFELVAMMALLAIVVLSALLSNVVVLVSSRFANDIQNLWLLWIMINTIGYGIGGFIGVYLGFTAFSDSIVTATLVADAMAGLIIGFAQWFLLRQLIKESGWWILATVMGFTIGSLFDTITRSIAGQMITGLLATCLNSAIIGFVLGLLQWAILQRQFDGAKIWITATMVGNVAGRIAGGILMSLSPMLAIPMLANAAESILPGAITGGVLVWLSQNYRLKWFQERA